jgi:AGCS family alanine or glycine:cation symporter
VSKMIEQLDLAAMIEKINQAVNGVVWGPFMLLLLLGIGVYFSIRLGFPQLTKVRFIFRRTLGSFFRKDGSSSGEGVAPFKATATALAGTLGTGNIVGVATAITAGGPGAVFWMWVSAFFGMVTKYAEICLAVKFREKNDRGEPVGGPMYYLEKGLKQKWLAVLFACFCSLAAFGIGNMTQINAISQSLETTFHINPLLTGVVCAVLVAVAVLGGVKSITSVTTAIVPVLALFYIGGAVISLVLKAGELPHVFGWIFEEAFHFRSAGGGIAGYAMMSAMRYGFSRGIFSNEAGLGSAPIAHAVSNTKEPVEQGIWGIFEVFVDTIIVCTMTALVILTSGVFGTGLDGADLTSAAFGQTLGNFAGSFISVSITLFAFSTLVSWSYYGEQCVQYLFSSKKAVTIYRCIYVLLVVVGAVMELTLVWGISDTMNGMMAIPNLIGLAGLSSVVIRETKGYFHKVEQEGLE